MLGLLIVLALGPAIGALHASPPQAPSASPQPTGTGRVTVHVIADNNGAPIKRARVVLSGIAAPPPRSGAKPGQVSSALSFTTNLPGTPQRDSNRPPEMAARRVSQTGETDETGTFSFTQLSAGSFSLMVTPEAGF